MFPEKAEYKSDHIILDKHSYEHDLKDFSFTFLELGKFNKSIERLSNIIDRWCYFFKYAQQTSKEELLKIVGNEPIISRAYEELDQFNWNDDELAAYEDAIKKQMDYDATMDQKYDEGIAKGQAEGIRVIASMMLKEGIDLGIIKKVTELSIQELHKLQQQLTETIY